MKTLQSLFSSIFPLPQSLTQIFQAQSFLLISPNSTLQSNPQNSILRCIQYLSEQQAHQNQVLFTSLSNAFHLCILSTQVKQISDQNGWCLIIEIQLPKCSLKQLLHINHQSIQHFTEKSLILIINCLNLLHSRSLTHITYQNLSFNQMIDNVLATQDQLIKLTVPSLIAPINLKRKDQNERTPNHKQILSSFGVFLFQIVTLFDKTQIISVNTLVQIVYELQFRTFPMKQLKSYLLSKLSQWIQSQKSPKINVINQRQFHHTQNRNSSKKAKPLTTQFQSPSHKQPPCFQSSSNHKPNKKFMTLNEMASDKIVQSFQQDEYSYILESNNSSPSRISPHKGFPNHALLNFYSEPSPTPFSPQQAHNVFEQSPSPIIDPQTQIRQSISNSKNSNLNSIIFEVEEESNYELVSHSSLKSDIVDLSFSQNQESQQIKELQDLQSGTKYFGEVVNGMKHGKGKIFYQDGGFYEGEWKCNTICGFGKLFYPSNKLAYAGYWKDGCFHGPGLVLNEQIEAIGQFDFTDFTNLGRFWISYRGNFNMDVREGFGIVKLSNGDSIGGNWEQNGLNGQVEYRRHDGQVITGIWKCNRLERILKQQIVS